MESIVTGIRATPTRKYPWILRSMIVDRTIRVRIIRNAEYAVYHLELNNPHTECAVYNEVSSHVP